MKITFVVLCLALILSACGGDARTSTVAPPEPTSGGEVAPTSAPVDTPTAGEPTSAPPADTPTVAPSDTPTPPTAARPRATPTSSGPLDFQFYVAGCRKAPTADKPGNAFFSISIEAAGGNGVYRYFHEGVELKTKFFEIERELGNPLIGKATVTSGDGQTLEKEYFFATGTLECTG